MRNHIIFYKFIWWEPSPMLNKEFKSFKAIPRWRDKMPISKKCIENWISSICEKIWVCMSLEQNFGNFGTKSSMIALSTRIQKLLFNIFMANEGVNMGILSKILGSLTGPWEASHHFCHARLDRIGQLRVATNCCSDAVNIEKFSRERD